MFDGFRSWLLVVLITSLLQEASCCGVKGEAEKAKDAAARAYKRAKFTLDGSLKLTEKRRRQLEQLVGLALSAYRLALIQSMSVEELRIVLPVLGMASKMPLLVMNAQGSDPMAIYEGVFEIAKERLDDSPELLRLLYLADESPAPSLLREIIHDFLDGSASRQETEDRLDRSTVALKEWIPRLSSEPE